MACRRSRGIKIILIKMPTRNENKINAIFQSHAGQVCESRMNISAIRVCFLLIIHLSSYKITAQPRERLFYFEKMDGSKLSKTTSAYRKACVKNWFGMFFDYLVPIKINTK